MVKPDFSQLDHFRDTLFQSLRHNTDINQSLNFTCWIHFTFRWLRAWCWWPPALHKICNYIEHRDRASNVHHYRASRHAPIIVHRPCMFQIRSSLDRAYIEPTSSLDRAYIEHCIEPSDRALIVLTSSLLFAYIEHCIEPSDRAFIEPWSCLVHAIF